MTKKIKPCPCCEEGQPDFKEYCSEKGEHLYYSVCKKCELVPLKRGGTKPHGFHTEKEAVKAWNDWVKEFLKSQERQLRELRR